MDRKAHLFEAAVKQVKDLMPGKEVNIHLMPRGELREDADYMAWIPIAGSGTKTNPVVAMVFLLEMEKRII